MAKPSARVVLNRKMLRTVQIAIADGLFEVARTMIEETHAPDAPVYGEGLPRQGGALAYVGDKKVAGWGLDGRQPKKPRAYKVRGQGAITAIAGWGFPARFNEQGTINQPARPFFEPTVNRVSGHVADIMRPIVADELRKAR